jgi:hypothetical protein
MNLRGEKPARNTWFFEGWVCLEPAVICDFGLARRVAAITAFQICFHDRRQAAFGR